MSWSHIRYRMSGQPDVDKVDKDQAKLQPSNCLLTSFRLASIIIARCIALAAKNIDEPISFIIKNSGQGLVALIVNADKASQIASEFQTITAVHTHIPVFFQIR